VLWPVIDRLTAENPDINVEVSIDSGLVDIVSGRFDAGLRLGERLDQDMVAAPISPKLRMAAFAAPGYLERHGTPQTPYDLAQHNCINLRMATSGGLYAWEFERDGKELKVKTEGQLVFNDADMIVAAALAGRGIAFTVEGHVDRHFANGSLVRVLEDWCEPFDGYYLYYPSRRQPSPAFSLVLDGLRYRG
jgi:DNA-binding transcriptional LysR family regulator